MQSKLWILMPLKTIWRALRGSGCGIGSFAAYFHGGHRTLPTCLWPCDCPGALVPPPAPALLPILAAHAALLLCTASLPVVDCREVDDRLQQRDAYRAAAGASDVPLDKLQCGMLADGSHEGSQQCPMNAIKLCQPAHVTRHIP